MSAGREETIVIDGYNLLRRGFRFQEEEHGLWAARAKLEVRLREFLRLGTGVRILLVYDGAAGPPFPAVERADPSLEIIFSRPPSTADDVVLEECRRLALRGPVTVVTSDLKDISQHLREPGIRHRTSEEFAEVLDEAMGRPGPGAGAAAAEEAPEREKPSAEEMPPGEVEEWVRVFSRPRAKPTNRPRGSTATESEIKYMLAGLPDYQKLVGPGGLPGGSQVERQENIYLDTADFRLANSRIMLRIRVSGEGSALLTLKSGTEVEAGYFRSTELEAPLEPEALAEVRRDPGALYRLPLAAMEELRLRFGGPALVVIGSLRTERKRYRAPGFVVEVDRMTFPDGSEEFEVEAETRRPDEARRWLQAAFDRLGVKAVPGRETKYARLLHRLGLR